MTVEDRSTLTHESTGPAPRLVYVLAHPMGADRLLRGQLADMRRRGYDVTVIASPGPLLAEVATREGVRAIALPMERTIRPLNDVRTLYRLVRLFGEIEPDIVNAGTTKAGLLGMVAARITGVRARIYVLRGLRLETVRGLRRWLLVASEHAATRCAHVVVCNSKSLRDTFVGMGFAPSEKTRILAGGSSNGVRFADFARSTERVAQAEACRSQLGIPREARVVGFVGRLARDKGVDDLLDAFEEVHERFPQSRLLCVGDLDPGDPPDPAVAHRLRTHPAVIVTGHASDPAPYYLLMDVLAFPSFREGFPNVPLEAACAGVPTAGYRATGTVDAVRDGVSGTLVELGDRRGLANTLIRYLDDPELRRAHGSAAKARVEREFSQEPVWNALADVYSRTLNGNPMKTVDGGPSGTSSTITARRSSEPPVRAPLLLSIDLEDWHQLIGRQARVRDWDQPNTALPRQIDALLALLDDLGARATFFVLGMTAKNYPTMLQRIVERGHEVASHGYSHEPVFRQSPREFRDDVERSIAVIEQATGRRPSGYRAPAFSLNRRCIWALETLVDFGFSYDSSLNDSPRIPDRIRPVSRAPFRMLLPSGRPLFEMPPAVVSLGRVAFPVGGGSYWRVLPYWALERGIRALSDAGIPAALYFHPYEFDPEPLMVDAGRKPSLRAKLTEARWNTRREKITQHLHHLCKNYPTQPYEVTLDELRSRSSSATLSPAGVYV